jgi:uncharacterized protein YndB with AHSA1/START domain
MDLETHVELRVTRRFNALPEHVFDAWADCETAREWLIAAAREQMMCVEIDARVGGWFYLLERRHGDQVSHVGEFVEVERPRRLAFRLSVGKYAHDFDLVTIEIDRVGTGCELTLTHEIKPERVANASRGWTRALDGLATTVSRSRSTSCAVPAGMDRRMG